jgi:hypothetical protein
MIVRIRKGFLLLSNVALPVPLLTQQNGLAALQTARAENRRFSQLSTPRAHTKPPYQTDLLVETRRALNRPSAARTVRSSRFTSDV